MRAFRLTYRRAALSACALAAGLLMAHGARADVIYLKKGGKIKGVIVSEKEDSIEIKTNFGTITLSRGAIAEIDKASDEINRALESQWQKEKKEKEEKDANLKKFEDEQRAKGLVKYKGAWVSAEKLLEVEKGAENKLEEEKKRLEEQRRAIEEMERRLTEMEARLERREQELNFREQQLAIREQNLLLQQQNLQRQAEQLAREKEVTPPKIFAIPRIEVVPPQGR